MNSSPVPFGHCLPTPVTTPSFIPHPDPTSPTTPSFIPPPAPSRVIYLTPLPPLSLLVMPHSTPPCSSLLPHPAFPPTSLSPSVTETSQHSCYPHPQPPTSTSTRTTITTTSRLWGVVNFYIHRQQYSSKCHNEQMCVVYHPPLTMSIVLISTCLSRHICTL